MIDWNDAFLIGDERIDFEHRMFLSLIRHFAEARAAGAPLERLLRILDEVALYARFHFKSEENLMQDTGFADFEEHRESHRQLVNELSNHLAGLDIQVFNPQEVETFLARWLTSHLIDADAEIGRHLAARRG